METRGQTHMWPSESSSSSIEVKTSMYMTRMCIPKANPSTYLITKYNIIGLNPCLSKIKGKKGGPKRHGSPEGVDSMQSRGAGQVWRRWHQRLALERVLFKG